MNEEVTDIQSTLLYRNAKAVQQQLEAQTEHIGAMKVEMKRLRNEVTILTNDLVGLRHQVDTMWVKHMGHGATE